MQPNAPPPDENSLVRAPGAGQWAACIFLGLAAAALPLWLLSDLMHVGDLVTMHVAVRLGLLTIAALLAHQIATQASGAPRKQWLWLILPAGLWAAAWPILDYEAGYTPSAVATARALPWWDLSLTKWGSLAALLLLGWTLRKRCSWR